ncbi:MAG: ATP-dependent Clp protease adapter ClpS [Actinomycetia bacterium]|nr:ATP-dependent Clp protease adapter ClpS [Actinomycetes bacterium]
MTAPGIVREPEVDEGYSPELPWTVIVWDDPVNLMDYVVYVFQEVLRIQKEKATILMLQVHNEGKSAVFSGMREPAEFTATRIASYGLWTTLER